MLLALVLSKVWSKNRSDEMFEYESLNARRMRALLVVFAGQWQVLCACRALARIGVYPRLKFLDLSGCLRLTGDGIDELVGACPALADGQLYYCDNIDGPLADTAGGCKNLECSSRACCRSGQ